MKTEDLKMNNKTTRLRRRQVVLLKYEVVYTSRLSRGMVRMLSRVERRAQLAASS